MSEVNRRSQLLIPALVGPDLQALEPVDLHALASALRKDTLFFGVAEVENAPRMRGSSPDPSFEKSDTVRPRRVGGRVGADAPWRLVVSEHPTCGPGQGEILKAMQPLTMHRAALEPLYFPEVLKGNVNGAIGQFYDRYVNEIASTSYFLLVGGGADLPILFQQRLSIGKAVGRLAFDRVEDYAAYSARVVRAELRGRSEPGRSIMVFGPDNDKATGISFKVLADPMVRSWRTVRNARRVIPLLGSDARRDGFLDWVRRDDGSAPSLLFSATHGMEYPDPTHPDQGALVDSNRLQIRWSDIVNSDAPVLEDGIAVLFACNSGGTPADRWWPKSYYRRPTQAPATDCLGRLPLGMLSHPRGALAAVAHVDILTDWGFSSYAGQPAREFEHPGVAPLRQLLMDLSRALPIGIAMRMVLRVAGELHQHFLRMLQLQSRRAVHRLEDDISLALGWLRWYDMQGWIVFGDPRVCLEGARSRLTLDDLMRQ